MTPEERVNCLMAVAEFRGIPPHTRATLAAAMREEFFAAGKTIIETGELADRMFVLCEGELEVSRPGLPGRPQRLDRGALLGELAFFAEGNRTATVRAATDCVLLSLPYPNFRDFLIAHPESALILAGRIARKLLHAEEELAAAARDTGSR
jgi:CRP-like cAMP-binding protein